MVFQIISIMEMTAFYACYFAKMYLQKKEGIQTDQMGKNKTGREKTIEVILKAVTCVVPVIELVSVLLLTPFGRIGMKWAGAVLGGLGVLIFIVSVATMKDSWRAGVSETEKTELVTSGIYSISRNPAFLGFDLLDLGILLLNFNWLLFAITIFAILMFHLQIVQVEEKFLIKMFGESYRSYQKRVCRYWGRKVQRISKEEWVARKESNGVKGGNKYE